MDPYMSKAHSNPNWKLIQDGIRIKLGWVWIQMGEEGDKYTTKNKIAALNFVLDTDTPFKQEFRLTWSSLNST